MLKNMLKYVRLAALRIILLVGASAVILWCRITRNPNTKRLELPLRWLRHYLAGTGTTLEVPEAIMEEAIPVFYRGLDIDAYRDLERHHPLNGSRFCVTSSVLYEGAGFYGRPTLFYLVGGFSFTTACDIVNGKPRVVAHGQDVYDWHAARDREGNPQYFTSPLGTGAWAYRLVKALGFLFGDGYFVTNGWPMGEVGISNRLWDDLHLVGAKAFRTDFRADLIRNADDESQIQWLARRAAGWEYGRRIQKWASFWEFKWTVQNRIVGEALYIWGLTGKRPEIENLVTPEEFSYGRRDRLRWIEDHHYPDEGKNMSYRNCLKRFISMNYKMEMDLFAHPQRLTAQRILG